MHVFLCTYKQKRKFYVCKHGYYRSTNTEIVCVWKRELYVCKHGSYTCMKTGIIRVRTRDLYVWEHGNNICMKTGIIRVQTRELYVYENGNNTCRRNCTNTRIICVLELLVNEHGIVFEHEICSCTNTGTVHRNTFNVNIFWYFN